MNNFEFSVDSIIISENIDEEGEDYTRHKYMVLTEEKFLDNKETAPLTLGTRRCDNSETLKCYCLLLPNSAFPFGIQDIELIIRSSDEQRVLVSFLIKVNMKENKI